MMDDKEPIKFPKKKQLRPPLGREGLFLCKCRNYTKESPPGFVPLVRLDEDGATIVAIKCSYCGNELEIEQGKLPLSISSFHIVEDPHSNDN